MSVETITIVLSAIGIVVALGSGTFAGMAWLVRRMDTIETRAVARAQRTDDRLDLFHAELKDDIAELRTELKTDIAELRTELKTDIAELRTELKTDIAELRTELKTDIAGVRVDVADLNREVTDVKVSVARWEGPRMHLALAH